MPTDDGWAGLDNGSVAAELDAALPADAGGASPPEPAPSKPAAPEPEPVAAAEPTEPPPPDQPAESPDELSQVLADLGPEYQGLSPAEAVKKLEAEYQAEQQAIAEAKQYREQNNRLQFELQQHQMRAVAQQEMQRLEAQRQQAWAQQQAVQQQRPKRVVPEFNPAWLSEVRYDDKGLPIPSPTLEKINAYREFKANEEREFIADPVKFLMERGWQDQVQQQREAARQEAIAVISNVLEDQGIEKFEDKWANWLYTDPRPVAEGGRQQPRPEGQWVGQRAQQIMAGGVRSRLQALNMAWQEFSLMWKAANPQGGQSGGTPAAAASPANGHAPATNGNGAVQTNEQKMRQVAVAAGAVKNNRGRQPPPAQSRPGVMPNFGQLLDAEMTKAGFGPEPTFR